MNKKEPRGRATPSLVQKQPSLDGSQDEIPCQKEEEEPAPTEQGCDDDEEQLKDIQLYGGEGETSYVQVPTTPDSILSCAWTPPSSNRTILKGDFETNERNIPEMTLAFIKPHAMPYADIIEKRIRNEGFNIINRRMVHLSPELASNFYKEHYGQCYFPQLILQISKGPILVFVLSKKDCVDKWRGLCGSKNVNEARTKWPDSLRARFGIPGEEIQNGLHGSDTIEKALEEIKFFFPEMKLPLNMTNMENVMDYMRELVEPVLLEGLANVCKHKPADPVIWLADWLLMHNPNRPLMEEAIAMTPT